METFFIKALQLIIALSILVFIHELGHYLFARFFGIKVEKFYLFLIYIRILLSEKTHAELRQRNRCGYSHIEAFHFVCAWI